jgi:hypothetical protein
MHHDEFQVIPVSIPIKQIWPSFTIAQLLILYTIYSVSHLLMTTRRLLMLAFIMAPTATFVSIKPSLFLMQPTSGI